MNRKQALDKACFLLREQAKEESLAKFLLMYMLDENFTTFNNNLTKELSFEEEKKYFSLIDEHIKCDKPLSHLIGFDYFYDRKFYVNENVLSPRMETEELVYKVINYIEKNNLDNFKILDLCTGSGIIAITLKKELESKNKNVKIYASDISNLALNVAQKNAENLQADVTFIQSDLFNEINDNFDIIVSNPPYISYNEKNTLAKNVLNYDPHLALFATENGLYFYRKIIEEAKNYLTKNGIIFFEIGYNQKDSIKKLAYENNFSATIYKDINGKDRIAQLKNNF